MAVVTTAAAIPFASAPRALLDWSFPISETCLWLTLIAWIIHRTWREQTRRRAAAAATVAAPADLTVTGYLDLYQELQGPVPWRERLRTALRRDLFGVPAGALLLVGTFSLLTVANPEYLRDSLRAYRWVIVEPVLFYFLATDIRAGRRQALRVADGFIGGAALAAALALALGFLNVPGPHARCAGRRALPGPVHPPRQPGAVPGPRPGLHRRPGPVSDRAGRNASAAAPTSWRRW